jgi:dihydroorotase
LKILIKNGHLIDPGSNTDSVLDVLISDNLIERIDRDIPAANDVEIIDATGLIVSPGLIDVHVHLREPGFEYKETIKSGTAAAAKGGFTSVVCMANTDPVNDNKSVTDYILQKARTEGTARVFPCGAITKGLKGQELAEIGQMVEAGIIAISDDGFSVKNAGLFLKALEYAKKFGIPAISHCEDKDLAQGVVHEGQASVLSGLDASPPIAEECVVFRDIAVARYAHSPLHITHVSTGGSVDIIRQAKVGFPLLTADTCPHYFSLTDEATLTYDTNTKVNPPLRSEGDVEAIKQGLKDGTIDIIATDHAPHEFGSKNVEFDLASFGISGLETALSLSLALVREGVLDLKGLLTKMTVNPARLLGIPYGQLAPGRIADLIVFNPHIEWVVDTAVFRSKGKNSPFEGWSLTGKNLLTIVDGRIVYRDPILPQDPHTRG